MLVPPNSNGSQFFITLDRCDWLDKKHTIFGNVMGDTLYNLLRLGEAETDKNDRPLEPPKILSVLWNPFEDIVPRTLQKPQTKATPDTDKKESKKKGVKNLSLLSFAEETEEEEKEVALVKKKIVSSHDVLNDPRLLKDEAPSSKKEEPQKDTEADHLAHHDSSDDNEADFDSRMRMQILKK